MNENKMIDLYSEWEKDKNIIVAKKNRLNTKGKRNIDKERQIFKIELFFENKMAKLISINGEYSRPVVDMSNLEIVKEF